MSQQRRCACTGSTHSMFPSRAAAAPVLCSSMAGLGMKPSPRRAPLPSVSCCCMHVKAAQLSWSVTSSRHRYAVTVVAGAGATAAAPSATTALVAWALAAVPPFAAAAASTSACCLARIASSELIQAPIASASTCPRRHPTLHFHQVLALQQRICQVFLPCARSCCPLQAYMAESVARHAHFISALAARADVQARPNP